MKLVAVDGLLMDSVIQVYHLNLTTVSVDQLLPNQCKNIIVSVAVRAFFPHHEVITFTGNYVEFMKTNCAKSCGFCCKDIAASRTCSSYESVCFCDEGLLYLPTFQLMNILTIATVYYIVVDYI